MAHIESATGEIAYIHSLGRYIPVSRRLENLAVHRARRGCPKAIAWLVRQHTEQILRIALKYKGQGVTLWDLYSEGRMGMLEAVHKFDPSRNVRFMTYAGWWVRQKVSRAIINSGRTIRVPVNVYQFRRSIARAEKALSQTLPADGRPGDADIAAHICARCDRRDCDADRKRAMLDRVTRHRNSPTVRPTRSLDQPTPAGRTLLEEIGDGTPRADPSARLEGMDLREMLWKAMAQLSPRERRIVQLRVIEERTLDEVSLTVPSLTTDGMVTRERVRQIEEKALKKLRRIMMSWYIRDTTPP